jgi:hypothetical protein
MSNLIRFDLHVARICATTTMEEFKRAGEALVFDEKYVLLLPSAPYCGRRLTCMRSYAEPVEPGVNLDAVYTAAPVAGASAIPSAAHPSAAHPSAAHPSAGLSTISFAAPPAINTSSSSSSGATPTATPTTTAANTPGTAARSHGACSECRRKKQRCERPSGTGSCNRCLRARGGPAVCSLAQP